MTFVYGFLIFVIVFIVCFICFYFVYQALQENKKRQIEISTPYPMEEMHPLPINRNILHPDPVWDTSYEFIDGGTTVTVSSQPVHASPVVVPPYPVDPRHPTPHSSGPPAPGFAPFPQTNTPYPPQVPMYYPPAVGAAPYPPGPAMTPYPPPAGGAPYPPAGGYPSSQPPPYHEAVSQPPIQPPPTHDAYSKQAPYNPHY